MCELKLNNDNSITNLIGVGVTVEFSGEFGPDQGAFGS